MDQNIVDEMLGRVNTLEAENNRLKEEIKEKKLKLAKKVDLEKMIKNLSSFEENLVSFSYVSDESDNLKKLNSSHNLMTSDQYEQKQNEENNLLKLGVEIIFSYLPYEQLNKLWIMGDFTDWEPKEMTKNKDIFTFKTLLLKGFKYYYCFNSFDHFYVDFNNEYELNPKNNQSNNYLILQEDNNKENKIEDIKLFDFKERSADLKKAKELISKNKISENYYTEMIRELQKLSKNYGELHSNLREKNLQTYNKLTKYFENILFEFDKSQTDLIKTINNIYKGRILKSNKINNILSSFLNKKPSQKINNENNPQIEFENHSDEFEYFYIDNINFLNNSINLIKLFDNNGIKINIDHYIKNGFFSSLLLDEFYSKREKVEILSKEESSNLLSQHNLASYQFDANSILKVFYSVNEEIEYDNPNDFSYKQDLSTNFFFRKNSLKQPRKYTIEKVQPERLTFLMDQYFIENNLEGFIQDIRGKSDNLKVLFVIEEVFMDQKIDYNNLPLGLNLYFSSYNNYLNLLHIDFTDDSLLLVRNVEICNYNIQSNANQKLNSSNSTRGIISQNSSTLKMKKFEEEYITQFFEKDENKNNDKLLILIRNLKTRRVVLRKANGEINEYKSEDYNIKKDSFMKISSFNSDIQIQKSNKFLNPEYKNCIVKIINIPVNSLIETKLYDFNLKDVYNDMKIDLNEIKNLFVFNEIIQDKDSIMLDQTEFENKNLKNDYVIHCEKQFGDFNNLNKFILNKNPFENNRLIDCSIVFDSNEKFINPLNISNTVFYDKNETEICLSACMLNRLENNKEMEFAKIFVEKEIFFNIEEIALLKKIKNNIENIYSVYFSDQGSNQKFISLTQNEKDDLLNKIKEDLQNMNKISFYIESKELWEYIESLTIIESQLNNFIGFCSI